MVAGALRDRPRGSCRASSSSWVCGGPTQGLRQHEHDKFRQCELSTKAIGLAQQSVEPLETQFAPRGGRPRGVTGPYIQRTADADADGAADGVKIIADPILLIRKTESDEQKICVRAAHEP